MLHLPLDAVTGDCAPGEKPPPKKRAPKPVRKRKESGSDEEEAAPAQTLETELGDREEKEHLGTGCLVWAIGLTGLGWAWLGFSCLCWARLGGWAGLGRAWLGLAWLNYKLS